MDPNFEVGPRRIFIIDGQFLTISREITYARFAKAETKTGREREENTSSGKKFSRKN